MVAIEAAVRVKHLQEVTPHNVTVSCPPRAMGSSWARDGHAQAQSNLGYMYNIGNGVPQDYVQSHMWRNLAASRATGADAKHFAEVRDSVAASMTRDQIAEAQRLAREWKPKD